MAELLADLLLDHDSIYAQVELVLTMAGVHWRVLDGIETSQFEQAKPALADLPWPLQAQESYTALTTLRTAEDSVMGSSVTVALGLTRLHLQAWIDVIDQADWFCVASIGASPRPFADCCSSPITGRETWLG